MSILLYLSSHLKKALPSTEKKKRMKSAEEVTEARRWPWCRGDLMKKSSSSDGDGDWWSRRDNNYHLDWEKLTCGEMATILPRLAECSPTSEPLSPAWWRNPWEVSEETLSKWLAGISGAMGIKPLLIHAGSGKVCWNCDWGEESLTTGGRQSGTCSGSLVKPILGLATCQLLALYQLG